MKYNRTITEARAIELLDGLYGVNPLDRVTKLEEEVKELFSSIIDHECDSVTDNEVIDELADCYIILTQLAAIYGVYGNQLLDIAIDKNIKRQTDPNYKR